MTKKPCVWGKPSIAWLPAAMAVLLLWRHFADPYGSARVQVPPPGAGTWSWSPQQRPPRRQDMQGTAVDARQRTVEISASFGARRQRRHRHESRRGGGVALDVGDAARIPGWLSDLSEIKNSGLDSGANMYEALVESAVKRGDFVKAARFADKAQEEGSWFDHQKLLAFAEDAFARSRASETRFWLGQLLKAGGAPRDELMDAVVARILRQKDFDAARKWLVDVRADPRKWLSRQAALIGKLQQRARDRKFYNLKDEELPGGRILRQAMKHGVQVGVDNFNQAVMEAASMSNMKEASFWFQESVRHGQAVPIETVNYIIRKAARTQGLRAAEFWFANVWQAGIQPSGFTWRYMMQAATSDDDPFAPERWFNNSVEAGETHNIWAYNILVAAACRRGDLDEAVRYFEAAVEQGLKPDECTYNTLINGAVNTTNIEAAEEWFRRLTEEDDAVAKSSVITYRLLMRLNMRLGRPWRVEELFLQMVREGLSGDEKILRYMRFAVGRARVLELCRQASVKPESFF